MATETRPAVLQEGTQRDLQETLRCRHLVRNLDTDTLRAEPIHRLIEQLKSIWPRLAAEIAAFQNWLTTIAAIEGCRSRLTGPQKRIDSVKGIQANQT